MSSGLILFSAFVLVWLIVLVLAIVLGKPWEGDDDWRY